MFNKTDIALVKAFEQYSKKFFDGHHNPMKCAIYGKNNYHDWLASSRITEAERITIPHSNTEITKKNGSFVFILPSNDKITTDTPVGILMQLLAENLEVKFLSELDDYLDDVANTFDEED